MVLNTWQNVAEGAIYLRSLYTTVRLASSVQTSRVVSWRMPQIHPTMLASPARRKLVHNTPWCCIGIIWCTPKLLCLRSSWLTN